MQWSTWLCKSHARSTTTNNNNQQPNNGSARNHTGNNGGNNYCERESRRDMFTSSLLVFDRGPSFAVKFCWIEKQTNNSFSRLIYFFRPLPISEDFCIWYTPVKKNNMKLNFGFLGLGLAGGVVQRGAPGPQVAPAAVQPSVLCDVKDNAFVVTLPLWRRK